MLISPRRFRASAVSRTLFLALGTALLGTGALPAAGQCALVNGPNQITAPSQWNGSYGGLVIWPKTMPRPYQAGGQDRLVIQLNYGHAVYSLANPATPSFLGLGDVRNDPIGPITKDGQSFVSGVAASSDGQRALYSMDVTGFGSTIVGAPYPAAFAPRGDTGAYRSNRGLVIQKTSGGRYIGYGLTSTGFLWASDITTLPSSFAVGNMSSEQAFLALSGASANYLQLAEGSGRQYLYWLNASAGGATVVVADARNPGPSGAITPAYPTWTIPFSDWGQPAADVLSYVSAAVDPQSATGNLYLLGLFKSASGTYYFALRSLSPVTGQTASVGTFTPPAPYGQFAGSRAALAAVNSFSNDVDVYMWTATASGPTGTLRLYATSARYFGSAIGQTVDFDKTVAGVPKSVADMSVLRTSATDVYAYLTDGIGGVTPYAIQMSCQSGPVAAAGHLAVTNLSTATPLASDATVFVGDTLQVTPSVTPPDAIRPITWWNLDLDYHASAETNVPPINFLQLAHPDACLFGCLPPGTIYSSNPDPPPFTLVGPCDPRNGGNATSGSGCWSSVVTGGDFTASPAAGTTATLPIAFEAENSLNTSTVPLALFNVVWKVPAVKPLGLGQGVVSALSNASNQATLQDASEGHPLATGYKWYFGASKTAPSGETLNADAACTGPACTHTFAAGKGTYNAYLVASYNGGYASPACGPPCTAPRAGSFVVNVTDFVAGFTASPTVYLGGSGINVTNQSQLGQGITATYAYTLCDATAGSCADGAYTSLSGSGPWSIPIPPTEGTWWLRIRATKSSDPSNPVQWYPAVSGVSDPSAWPVSVQKIPPSIHWVSGVQVGAGGAYVTAGQAASVALFGAGGNQLTDPVSWTISSGTASPMSAAGVATFTFTAASGSASLVIGTAAAGVSSLTLGVYTPNPGGGSSGPTVSVSAVPSSVNAGQAVTLSASASGGSGSYSTYTWNFGDGTVPVSGPASLARQVTHVYTAPNSYYPQCRVTDSAGRSGTGSTAVFVGGSGPGGSIAVSVTASASSAAVGISINFTAAATGGSGTYTNYFWNFGDGQVATGPYSSATHAYLVPGSYVTTCTVTDSQGHSISGQAAVTIAAVSGPPDFRITYPGGSDAVLGTDGSFLVVAGQQNTFRVVSAANPSQTLTAPSASWAFGDQGTAIGSPVSHAFAAGGTYQVHLTLPGAAPVWRNVHAVGGIPTAAYSYSYSLNPGPGDAVDPGKVAPHARIVFSSSGPPGASYFWDFGDGTDCLTDPTSPCASVTSHAYAAPGAYRVVLTVVLGGNSFSTPAPTTFNVVDQRWVVPGLAYTSGVVPGSFYVTDVVIQNTSADPAGATYSVALLDGQDPPNWIPLDWFQPLESRRYLNVLKNGFGKAAGGPTYAIVIRGDSVPTDGDPAIWAFTYNNNAGDPSKGTYGVAIPGVPVSMAAAPASPTADREFPGLRDVPLTALPNISAAYTNIGFVNAGLVPAAVNVSFVTRGADGPVTIGNTFPINVGPNSTRQVTQSLRQALAGTQQAYEATVADGYYMTFDVVGDGAKVVPYASVKDVASTDSIFLTAAPNVSAAGVRIPSIVRVGSATGDRFRSRVVIFNASFQDRAVKLTFSYRRCPAGGACEDRVETSLTTILASHGTIQADDFVAAWFANLGSPISDTDNVIQSYLDVAPADANTDPLIVRGETYNSQTTGNFGTQVPGLVPEVHGATAGGARTRLVIPYVVPKSGGSGYRTNVAFVALGDTPAQATVRLREPFQNSGFPAAQDAVVTVDDKFLQLSLEKLFPELASFPQNPGGYYSVEIDVTGGTLAAYAIVNDNVTSDGSLILAKPLPPLAQQP